MSALAPIQATSIGRALDVVTADAGVVHGVYSHALNLAVRGDLWTVLAAERSDLPFGIRTATRDLAAYGVRGGDPVHVRSGYVGIGRGDARVIIDCRAASRWSPAAPTALAPGLDRRLRILAAAVSERAWHGSTAMADDVVSALDDADSLRRALARVVGCGPGLTPAGDDVLVGILSVLAAPLPILPRPGSIESLRLSILALLRTTTDVSGHMLRQACSGLFGRAVHELVSALIESQASGKLDAAVRRVVAVGATSGADICAGMLAAARRFSSSCTESAAA